MLKALSLHPQLLRWYCSLLVLASIVTASALTADSTPAPAEKSEARPAEATITIATNASAPSAPSAGEGKPVELAPAPAADMRTPATPPASAPIVNTNVSPRSLEAFRLIADRNIFNQSRSPRISSTSRPPSTNEVRRAPRVEAFALVGTMSYEKGDFAFFDSGNPEFRKTLKPGDVIAGYKLEEVKPTQVTLALGGEKTELKVGQQLRREEDGPWQVGAHSGGFVSSGGSSGSSSGAATTGGSSSSSGGSASEILKRLMEQRARER